MGEPSTPLTFEGALVVLVYAAGGAGFGASVGGLAGLLAGLMVPRSRACLAPVIFPIAASLLMQSAAFVGDHGFFVAQSVGAYVPFGVLAGLAYWLMLRRPTVHASEPLDPTPLQ